MEGNLITLSAGRIARRSTARSSHIGEPLPARSCLGDSGAAHVVDDPGVLGKIKGVVAPDRGLEIRDCKVAVESQSGCDLGPRFIQSTCIRQRCCVNKMTQGEISIGFDRLTKPRGRLLVAAEQARREAGRQ